MGIGICEICQKPIPLQNKKFCSKICESINNRIDRPSKEWLEQKYLTEDLDCPQIAKLLKKDAKTIYTWLKDASIPTRSRGSSTKKNRKEGAGGRPGGWKMSNEQKEKIRQARLKDGHVPYLKNGIHWLKGKSGKDSPVWKGGITPERQAFYGTIEWRKASKEVRKRDKGICQRCKQANKKLDIHHIISFACKEGRAAICNLVSLCESCHYWVHSRENTKKEFIIEYE